jgi:hypothetical protein
MQLAYELRYNPSWKLRYKIIFGNSSFKPPVTKDYLIVSDKGEVIEEIDKNSTSDNKEHWLIAG